MTNQEAIKMLTAKVECIRRETSGTDIDCNLRNCDECELCYEQGTTGEQIEALNMAFSALQAQDVPDTNVGDMVSRQAAIDAECEVCQIAPKKERGHNCIYYVHGCKEIECLRVLPSALPEPLVKESRTLVNDLVKDTISRQAALETVRTMHKRCDTDSVEDYRDLLVTCFKNLPSAQPEIVRCKDCENWIPGYITDNDDFIPPKCGKYQQMVGHSSDDYCSLAERRTDGSD